MSPSLDMQVDPPGVPEGEAVSSPRCRDEALGELSATSLQDLQEGPPRGAYAPFSDGASLPLELVVTMLSYLGASDLERFATCCVAFAEQAHGANDERLWRPLLGALRRRFQRPAAGRGARGAGDEAKPAALASWRAAYGRERVDLRRTCITREEVAQSQWRLRFSERASGSFFATPHEPIFLPDGTLVLQGYPRMPWRVAEEGRVVLISEFPPHAVGRRSSFDGAWTLTNDNVTMWTVDRLCAEAHAGDAAKRASLGDAHAKRGRHARARLEYRAALAHCGGASRDAPWDAEAPSSGESPGSPWSRYRADPGAEAIEAAERALTTTLTARERLVRTAVLARLAGAALECGERAGETEEALLAFLEALDCARRALATHIEHGKTAKVVESRRDAAVRALLRIHARDANDAQAAAGTPRQGRSRAPSISEAPTRPPSPDRDMDRSRDSDRDMDRTVVPGTDAKSVLTRLFEWAALAQ